ncbi:MAG: reverse transcriptase domain-containing protein [Syntrophobacteraceae bacterium]
MTVSEMAEHENLLRAFQRAESAGGIPGVDGVSFGAFRRHLAKNLDRLGGDLKGQAYLPGPLLRVLVAGAAGSPRGLYVPTVRDRTAQGALMNLVEPILELHLENSHSPHLTTRCMRQAARRAGELRELGYHYLVNGLIESYFQNIDLGVVMHRCGDLLEDAPMVRLVERWVRPEVYDCQGLGLLDKGIPEGTVIGRLLAKLLLDDLDDKLAAKGAQIVRYGDDLVVLARNPLPGGEAMEITPEVLENLQLSKDPEDSEMWEFWNGMECRGFLFRGDWTLAAWDRRANPLKILHVPPLLDAATYLEDHPNPEAPGGSHGRGI